jgi:hypothetical protein
MEMAASVVANELVGHGRQEKSKPRPSRPERVGHTEKQNQFLSVDVLEWYHSIVLAGNKKNVGGWATRELRDGNGPAMNIMGI